MSQVLKQIDVKCFPLESQIGNCPSVISEEISFSDGYDGPVRKFSVPFSAS